MSDCAGHSCTHESHSVTGPDEADHWKSLHEVMRQDFARVMAERDQARRALVDAIRQEQEACIEAAGAAIGRTFENERRAISKGSARYSSFFMNAAIVEAVGDAIRSREAPLNMRADQTREAEQQVHDLAKANSELRSKLQQAEAEAAAMREALRDLARAAATFCDEDAGGISGELGARLADARDALSSSSSAGWRVLEELSQARHYLDESRDERDALKAELEQARKERDEARSNANGEFGRVIALKEAVSRLTKERDEARGALLGAVQQEREKAASIAHRYLTRVHDQPTLAAEVKLAVLVGSAAPNDGKPRAQEEKLPESRDPRTDPEALRKCIGDLLVGIKKWAAQEDGVPDWLWESVDWGHCLLSWAIVAPLRVKP